MNRASANRIKYLIFKTDFMHMLLYESPNEWLILTTGLIQNHQDPGRQDRKGPYLLADHLHQE